MSEEQTVTYELDGEIALVGLNRPDKRNCFNPTVMTQLREGEKPADGTAGVDGTVTLAMTNNVMLLGGGDDRAEEFVCIEQHFILEEDVVDANHRFFSQYPVIDKR